MPALDSTLSIGSIGASANAGILRTQLSRYQIQLADWCHCPSGKTPEGQRKIADLQAKADSTNAQLQRVDAARSAQKVAATSATSDSATVSAYSTLGSLIDVLA